MGKSDERGKNGAGARFDIGAHALVGSLNDRPPVISTPLDAINHFPLLPTDVAHPKIAGYGVNAHSPWIAQSKRIDLGPRAGRLDERIVGRDCIRIRPFGPVHIDPQDTRKQVADVLAGIIGRVGRIGIGSVARGNVEKPILTEGEGAPVVASAQPPNDDVFAGGIDHRRRHILQCKTRNVGAIRPTSRFGVANENEMVLQKAGMKRKRVGGVEGFVVFAEIEYQIRRFHATPGRKGIKQASLFEEEKPV